MLDVQTSVLFFTFETCGLHTLVNKICWESTDFIQPYKRDLKNAPSCAINHPSIYFLYISFRVTFYSNRKLQCYSL